MTSFTWLDYSEHERKQAMEVIDLFREEDTRDELGLGTIRDVFADLLFPGTSTIQTRARYFLFVPWIYADIERQKTPSHDANADRENEASWLDPDDIGHSEWVDHARFPTQMLESLRINLSAIVNTF